jgi:hypothetical protein
MIEGRYEYINDQPTGPSGSGGLTAGVAPIMTTQAPEAPPMGTINSPHGG